MTKRRSTKSALISSVLALLLCFTMLLGTTFAWFTDSVTSASNIIKSGTLDVTMEWKDATATGAQQDYKDASAGAIFNNDKWEPGYVEAKNIKISNVGTLALKYHLNIAANGEVSELSDVIDVYYAEGAYVLTDRDMTELTRIGTLTDVLAGMPGNMAGDLEAKTSDTVTIALKMQENAGNDYQGLSIGTNFSVILMATQDNVEKDAFDENYDDIEIPNMDIRTIDGVTYGTTIDGQYVMISVDDYTLTTFTVNENVTVLGTGDGVNDNDRIFGKNAPLTSLTLPEGLTEIKDNALNTLPNLTTVNIPSTVKTIGIQAFRITGMSEVTLPENVETVKLGAFRDMANLTTVTVEGNVAFDNYAFRSCPNLTSIYLLGDDVTFTGSQFATHDDNGACTSDAHKDNCPGLITIYVKNATVAARVIAAQGTSTCYEVKILGTEADGSDASTVVKAANTNQLNTALANGATTIVLNAGNYTFREDRPQIPAGTTIVGQDGVNFTNTLAGNLENVTLKNIHIEAENVQRWGYAEGTVVFEDCIFDAVDYAIHFDTLYGANVTYKNCTIIGGAAVGSGAESVTFDGCTILGNGTLGILRSYSPATIKNCTFDVSDVDPTDTIQDGIHAVNCEIKVSNNTNVNGDMKDLYYISGTGVITEE